MEGQMQFVSDCKIQRRREDLAWFITKILSQQRSYVTWLSRCVTIKVTMQLQWNAAELLKPTFFFTCDVRLKTATRLRLLHFVEKQQSFLIYILPGFFCKKIVKIRKKKLNFFKVIFNHCKNETFVHVCKTDEKISSVLHKYLPLPKKWLEKQEFCSLNCMLCEADKCGTFFLVFTHCANLISAIWKVLL